MSRWFPTLIPLAQIGPQDYAALVIVTAVVLLLVLVPYILLAAKARELLKEPSALKLLTARRRHSGRHRRLHCPRALLTTDIRQTGRIWQKILFAPAPPIIRFWRGFRLCLSCIPRHSIWETHDGGKEAGTWPRL